MCTPLNNGNLSDIRSSFCCCLCCCCFNREIIAINWNTPQIRCEQVTIFWRISLSTSLPRNLLDVIWRMLMCSFYSIGTAIQIRQIQRPMKNSKINKCFNHHLNLYFLQTFLTVLTISPAISNSAVCYEGSIETK